MTLFVTGVFLQHSLYMAYASTSSYNNYYYYRCQYNIQKWPRVIWLLKLCSNLFEGNKLWTPQNFSNVLVPHNLWIFSVLCRLPVSILGLCKRDCSSLLSSYPVQFYCRNRLDLSLLFLYSGIIAAHMENICICANGNCPLYLYISTAPKNYGVLRNSSVYTKRKQLIWIDLIHGWCNNSNLEAWLQ